ncbi:HNH endonuclease [Acidiphilium sp. MT5]
MTNFAPILWKRGEFGLAGNSGKAPSRFNIFDGEAKLAEDPDKRLKVRYNPTTEKFDISLIFHKRKVQLPNGTIAVQITVDAKERKNIPKIIQRERKRQGMRSLTDEEMSQIIGSLEVQEGQQPTFIINPKINFARLRHAMLKIVYELAFMWLGETYLDDPSAATIRAAILNPDSNETQFLMGSAGLIPEGNSSFKLWQLHPKHHLAYGIEIDGTIIIAIRIFDLLEATIPVTERAGRYISNMKVQNELRYLVIDATSGVTHDSSWLEEVIRVGQLMSINGQLPPFPDPLASPP